LNKIATPLRGYSSEKEKQSKTTHSLLILISVIRFTFLCHLIHD